MRIVRLFRPTAVAAIATAAVALTVAGCATTAPANASNSSGGGTKINVVAAENFWGSIASQLGGDHATVTSIITNPDTDPHDYDATPADGRTIAGAQFVIVNGVGYDPWAPKLLAGNANPNRTVLTVGQLVGIPDGGNPHRWYSPTNVHQVIEQIAADYAKIDPADAGYFQQRKETFENQTLSQYNQLISTIKSRYAGTPIGASESIVSPLAEGLGLNLITPETFLDAISEGSDPTAADKATIDSQIRTKQIKIYVYNSQNSTPDVQTQVNEAKAAGIPVTTVTETLAPAGATFQDWQVKELQGVQQALAQATGK
ncbi:MAG TPA: zinc ABC transporter substrate-binding protein [Pseudonocardiaceae bacterium]|nr:zinc ABC transporter substrate-binding protein [Pseudonocardiaceae bacterium]